MENHQNDIEMGIGGDSKTELDGAGKAPVRKISRIPSQTAGKGSVNVLDLSWTPPDIQKAKLYADYVQPR